MSIVHASVSVVELEDPLKFAIPYIISLGNDGFEMTKFETLLHWSPEKGTISKFLT
jgi:hypothetical protein